MTSDTSDGSGTANPLYGARSNASNGAISRRAQEQAAQRAAERERQKEDRELLGACLEDWVCDLDGYRYRYFGRSRKRADGTKPRFAYFTEKIDGWWVSAVVIEGNSIEPEFRNIKTHRLRREAKARAEALHDGWSAALGTPWAPRVPFAR